jgi:hypothetical protein
MTLPAVTVPLAKVELVMVGMASKHASAKQLY